MNDRNLGQAQQLYAVYTFLCFNKSTQCLKLQNPFLKFVVKKIEKLFAGTSMLAHRCQSKKIKITKIKKKMKIKN